MTKRADWIWMDGALKRWEETDTHNVISRVESIENPGKRLRELFRLTSREMRSHKIYAALLRASDHPVVAPVMDRVSEERMIYLARVFQQAGMDEESSMHRARLAYSAYIGLLQLTLQFRSTRLSQEVFDAYVGHMIETLIPAEPGRFPWSGHLGTRMLEAVLSRKKNREALAERLPHPDRFFSFHGHSQVIGSPVSSL